MKELNNETGKSFLLQNKAHREHISITDADFWLGYFIDNKLVGVISIIHLGNKIRVKEFYTLKEFRGRGIGSSLLQEIIKKYGNVSYSAFATKDSLPIFLKFGFIKKSERNGISFLVYN